MVNSYYIFKENPIIILTRSHRIQTNLDNLMIHFGIQQYGFHCPYHIRLMPSYYPQLYRLPQLIQFLSSQLFYQLCLLVLNPNRRCWKSQRNLRYREYRLVGIDVVDLPMKKEDEIFRRCVVIQSYYRMPFDNATSRKDNHLLLFVKRDILILVFVFLCRLERYYSLVTIPRIFKP